MSAALSAAEQAIVDRFDAAAPAPESLRERVARAMHTAVCDCGTGATNIDRKMATAAIRVITGGAS